MTTDHPFPFQISTADLNREVAAYRAARAHRLTADKGWLTLIGKVWLSPGVARIGSGPDCEIRLPPEAAPAQLGRVTLENGVVRFDAQPGAQVFARGQQVDHLVLRSDAESVSDQLVAGSITMELIRRGDDLAIRVRDSSSPLRRSFAGIPCYPVVPDWRIVAAWEPFASEKSVIYQDNDGRPQPYLCPGTAVFQKDGVDCRIEPVFDSDRSRLFMLFADATNRDQTYQAGRFLYLPLPVYLPLPFGGRVVLDFNKAFNPPCAFTDFAACPLPPRENRLDVRVEAGEKRPG